MSVSRRLIWIVIGAVCLSSTSCSDSRLPPKKPVVKVSGRVLVDGEPAEGIVVTLRPLTADAGLYQLPMGLTNEDGDFKLSTYSKEDGAPAGEYVSIFFWPVPDDELVDDSDKLKRLYLYRKDYEKDKPQFKVTVANKPLVLEPFELKLAGQKVFPMSSEELKELEIRKNGIIKARSSGQATNGK